MTIYKTARFQVRPEGLETALSAIRDVVGYIQAYEPGTQFYTSLQAAGDPTHFLHVFAFDGPEAEERHRTSPGVQRFTQLLYPQLVDGVAFTDYTMVASTKATIA